MSRNFAPTLALKAPSLTTKAVNIGAGKVEYHRIPPWTINNRSRMIIAPLPWVSFRVIRRWWSPGQVWSNLVEVGPTLVELEPMLVDLLKSQMWQEAGPSLADFTLHTESVHRYRSETRVDRSGALTPP